MNDFTKTDVLDATITDFQSNCGTDLIQWAGYYTDDNVIENIVEELKTEWDLVEKMFDDVRLYAEEVLEEYPDSKADNEFLVGLSASILGGLQ
ncbi:MAG: hypothetical protein QM504_03790 [Pseudomonadota bacterium]